MASRRRSVKSFISRIKPEYADKKINTSGANNPYAIFKSWLKDAKESKNPEPNAMVLSTLSLKKNPTSRMVLLKDLNNFTLSFFTNYESSKAKDLIQNKKVSLLFYWGELERQVRITGTAKKTSAKINQEYFATRPRQSQIAAWVSLQSRKLGSRKSLDAAFSAFEKKFNNTQIPCPPFWGGYEVKVESIEFWQGRKNRLHDRIFFEKSSKGWKKSLLFP